MAITVKRITIWSVSQSDQAGLLGRVLEPLAKAKADVQVVMGYKLPGEGGRATIEVAPVTGKAVKAARAAGLSPSGLPGLLVVGDNRAGVGFAIGSALGQAGISMHYLMAQVVGRKFSAVIGFGSEDEAKRAAPLIKKAAARRS
jgi:hypothetical protein